MASARLMLIGALVAALALAAAAATAHVATDATHDFVATPVSRVVDEELVQAGPPTLRGASAEPADGAVDENAGATGAPDATHAGSLAAASSELHGEAAEPLTDALPIVVAQTASELAVPTPATADTGAASGEEEEADAGGELAASPAPPAAVPAFANAADVLNSLDQAGLLGADFLPSVESSAPPTAADVLNELQAAAEPTTESAAESTAEASSANTMETTAEPMPSASSTQSDAGDDVPTTAADGDETTAALNNAVSETTLETPSTEDVGETENSPDSSGSEEEPVATSAEPTASAASAEMLSGATGLSTDGVDGGGDEDGTDNETSDASEDDGETDGETSNTTKDDSNLDEEADKSEPDSVSAAAASSEEGLGVASTFSDSGNAEGGTEVEESEEPSSADHASPADESQPNLSSDPVATEEAVADSGPPLGGPPNSAGAEEAVSPADVLSLIPKSPGRPAATQEDKEIGDDGAPPSTTEQQTTQAVTDILDNSIANSPESAGGEFGSSSSMPTETEALSVSEQDQPNNPEPLPEATPDFPQATDVSDMPDVKISGGTLTSDSSDAFGDLGPIVLSSIPPGARGNSTRTPTESIAGPLLESIVEGQGDDDLESEASPEASLESVNVDDLLNSLNGGAGDLDDADQYPEASSEVEFAEASSEYPEPSGEFPESSEDPDFTEEPDMSEEPYASGEAEDVSIVLLVNHPVQFEPAVLADEIAFISDEFIADDAWVVESILPLSSVSKFSSIQSPARQSSKMRTFELSLSALCPTAISCEESMDQYRTFIRDQSMDQALAARDYAQVFVYVKGDKLVERGAGLPEASSSGLSSSAIAGIAVGGIACVSLVALAVVFALRRNSRDDGAFDAERGEYEENVYDETSGAQGPDQVVDEQGSFLISNFGGSPRNTSAMNPSMNEPEQRNVRVAGELNSNSFISVDTVGTAEMANNNMSTYRFEDTTSSSSGSDEEYGAIQVDEAVTRA